MILNLEQLSNENLVYFYKDEFQMIDLGEPASTFFSASTIKGLIKKGILKTTRAGVRAGSRTWITTITDMTRTLISKLK